jgi:hypothetical protein
MAGSHVPKQCRSCGGFCGGGYGNKFCQNTAHIKSDVQVSSRMMNAGANELQELLAKGSATRSLQTICCRVFQRMMEAK